MSTPHPDPYIPALGHDRFTPYYDLFQRWLTRELTFKRRLVEQAGINAGDRVLDLGCGTATLTLLAKQSCPQADIFGLDGDAAILALAQAKARQQQVALHFQQGFSSQLPYQDQTFAVVLASLMVHHLTAPEKQRTMREVFRILQPGGKFLILDFGPPHTPLAALLAWPVQHFEQVADHVKGLLPAMLRTAGFAEVAEVAYFMSAFGSLSLYQAQKVETQP